MVDPDGEQVGVLPRDQALFLADQLDLDLVEVAPQARPPVTRLMDYGKWKYTRSVSEREARRRQRRQGGGLKEVTFGLKIEDHDLARKRRRAEEFLAGGDKVKVTVRFRGRERAYPERADALLERFLGEMDGAAEVVAGPEHTGRVTTMVLQPAS